MNILLVHQSESVNEYFALSFSLMGHPCRTLGAGTTPAKFMEELKFRMPDLVILDPSFKDLNPFKLCSELEALGRHKPICVFYGDMKEPEEVLEAYLAGADACLPKTADIKEFLMAVHAARHPAGSPERARRLHRA